MTKKYIANIDGYTAKSLEWNGSFDLMIYKGKEEVYRHNLSQYSLDDLSKVVRRVLDMPRKRIAWVEEK